MQSSVISSDTCKRLFARDFIPHARANRAMKMGLRNIARKREDPAMKDRRHCYENGTRDPHLVTKTEQRPLRLFVRSWQYFGTAAISQCG